MNEKTENFKPKIKRTKSGSESGEFMPQIYEIHVRSRVVRKGAGKPIKGRQGMWYEEKIYWVTENEEYLREIIVHHIRKRRILGKAIQKLDRFIRRVEILDIKRIV